MDKEPRTSRRDKLKLLATAVVSFSLADGAALLVAGGGYAAAEHYGTRAYHESRLADSGVQLAKAYNDADAAAYWQHESDGALDDALICIVTGTACAVFGFRRYVGSAKRRYEAAKAQYVQETVVVTDVEVQPPVPDGYWQPPRPRDSLYE